jgi:hypothetical protein
VYLTFEKGDMMCFGHIQRKAQLGHTNRVAVKDWLDESNTLRTEAEILPNTKVSLECDECHFRTAELKMTNIPSLILRAGSIIVIIKNT